MTENSAVALEAIQKILKRRTGPRAERRLLDHLRPLSSKDVVEVLEGLDLRRLLQAMDARVWGMDSRSDFLAILESNVGGLKLETKALLVGLLAEGSTNHQEEKVLRAIFLSETGQALSELKLQIDTSHTGHDLLALLTRDIDAPDLRYDIIKHFHVAAPVIPDPRHRPLRVVSDIDDTLYSSLKDVRYPRGTLYSGVLELFAAASGMPPVFLTARPEFISGIIERLTHRQLRGYGLRQPTVLSGTLPGLLGHRRMAQQKARTLTSYTELYPEHRFVFFGDSGQADMAFCESLLQTKESVLERAFIHKLADHHRGSKTKNPRIHLFSNYGEAARLLHGFEYITTPQRDEIVALVEAIDPSEV